MTDVFLLTIRNNKLALVPYPKLKTSWIPKVKKKAKPKKKS